MADVKMPKSVPCKFNAKGWAPCKKPSTKGLCSKHEKLKCVSCGQQALRSCAEGMGGLACGAPLCATCQHGTEDGHVTKLLHEAQMGEEMELAQTGRESKRMLALRGVPTDIPLPSHLEALLKKKRTDFGLMTCYYLRIKHGLMGEFPAILKGKRIVVITPDKDSIIRVWQSLTPTDSEIVADSWMVNGKIGVAYRMCSDKFDQGQSRPYKIFSKKEIVALFTGEERPFEWAPGLIGGEVSKERFEALIQRELAA